jgi:hypothetical protein
MRGTRLPFEKTMMRGACGARPIHRVDIPRLWLIKARAHNQSVTVAARQTAATKLVASRTAEHALDGIARAIERGEKQFFQRRFVWLGMVPLASTVRRLRSVS